MPLTSTRLVASHMICPVRGEHRTVEGPRALRTLEGWVLGLDDPIEVSMCRFLYHQPAWKKLQSCSMYDSYQKLDSVKSHLVAKHVPAFQLFFATLKLQWSQCSEVLSWSFMMWSWPVMWEPLWIFAGSSATIHSIATAISRRASCWTRTNFCKKAFLASFPVWSKSIAFGNT